MTRPRSTGAGPGHTEGNVTLADFIERDFIPEQLAGSKSTNIKQYRIIVRAFLRKFGADVRCTEITPAMVDAFKQARIDEGKPARAFRYRSTMVAIMLAWHAKHGGNTPCTFHHRSSGRPVIEHPLTPGSLWCLYRTSYRPKNLRGGSIKTDRQYRIQLNHFAANLGREPVLADLNEETVSAFLDAFAQTHAARTVNKALYSLRALWEHAARRRLVPDFPTLVAMQEPRRIPRCWTVDELARLFDACLREPGTVAGIEAGDWWHALHMACWGTGERVGAALAIRLADVDFDRGEILIPAEVRKAKSQDMLYRLRPETLEALAKIREPDRELLFPWPWHVGTFYNHYKRILRRAGLPTDRSCKPQKIRRSFASYVEAAGGNATAALAHGNRSTTVRSYLDPRICGGGNPADLLPPLPPSRKDDAA